MLPAQWRAGFYLLASSLRKEGDIWLVTILYHCAMKHLCALLLLGGLLACTSPTAEPTSAPISEPTNEPNPPVASSEENAPPKVSSEDAQAIVDAAIYAHGGERYKNFELVFQFRERTYTAARDYEDNFTYVRSFKEDGKSVNDVLNQEGFHRRINNKKVELSAEKAQAYENSVNSVLYFILLPSGLNDPAVKKSYLGEMTIEEEPYHMVEVRFAEEGGGVDHQDVFVYWFHQENKTMDYLGYSYETEGGGLRFRKAFNSRKVNGMLFQDYVNYKAEVIAGRTVQELGQLYEKGQLDSLSSIISTQVNIGYP